MEPWEIVAEVSRRQHMLIATWQAVVAGVSRRALAARVAGHGWVRYHHGVIGLPGPDSPLRQLAALVLAYARPVGGALRVTEVAPGDDNALVDAIVSAALNAGQVVTGRSGAWLHGFAPQPDEHSLWLPFHSGRRIRSGARLRYGGSQPGEQQRKDGLPVFDPEGCIIETARTPVGTRATREAELIWQLSRADSLRVASTASVRARAQTLGMFCGCDVLDSALATAAGTLSHSKVEHRGRDLVAEALAPLGLVPEPRPYAITVDGVTIAEADVAIVPIRLDVEVDGPHHLFLDQRLKDEERDRKLRRVAWEVERFPLEVVRERPHVFKARVRAAAEARLALLDRS